MLITKCDRCKREITERADNYTLLVSLGTKLREALKLESEKYTRYRIVKGNYDGDSLLFNKALDLCPACYKSLMTWLNTTEEVKQDE